MLHLNQVKQKMRYFIFPLLFISFLSNAQDNVSFKGAGKKTDTITSRFIISFNGGVSIPEEDYRTPSTYSQGINNGDAFGLSGLGYQMELNGIYILSQKVGIEAKLGMDENGSTNGSTNNSVAQYFTGFNLSIDQNHNVSFVGLIGLVSANIPTTNYYGSHYGGSGVNTVPGKGYGFGGYFGLEFTFKVYRKFYFNSSAGYLLSNVNFPTSINTNYTLNRYLYSNNATYTTTTTTSDLKMDLGIIDVNFGISYHI